MMNYREVPITDSELRDRLSLNLDLSDSLCDELSQMTIMNPAKPVPAGIFSRLKSTLFSSYESQIRSPYVASCTVQVPSTGVVDSHLHLCVTAEGNCKLLRLVLDTSPPSAIELSSIDLPSSQEGYSVCSVYLGSTQGSLCVASVGGGQIYVLLVLDEKLSVTKTFSLPLTVPVTSVCVFERSKQIELCLVLGEEDILILPDITKPTIFSFVYTMSLKNRIKKLDNTLITEDSLSVCKNLIKPSDDPMKVSFLFNDNDFPSFYEKVMKEQNIETIEGGVKIVKIDDKLLIHRNSKCFSQIIQFNDRISQYVTTFKSVPIVSSLIDRRVSRDLVLSFFKGDEIWAQIFSISSVAESIMFGFTVSLLIGSMRLEDIRKLVKDKFDNLQIQVVVYLKKISETNSIWNEIKKNISLDNIESVFYLSVAFFINATYRGEALPSDFITQFERIRLARWLVEVYKVENLDIDNIPRSVLLDSPQIGWIATCKDKSWKEVAEMHINRFMAKRDYEVAFQNLKKIEIAILHLFKSKLVYWDFVSKSFDASYLPIWLHLLSLEAPGSLDFKKRHKNCFENAVFSGNYPVVQQLLATASDKEQYVALLCSEARIRGELGEVFDMVKEDRKLQALIIGEIETDLKVDEKFASWESIFSNHLQIYKLAIISQNFSKAIATMLECYESLLCRCTALEGEFEEESDIHVRLDFQYQSLVLAQSVGGELRGKILWVKGLRALYSFSDEPVAMNPTELSRSLSALGLIILSAKISRAFNVSNFFTTTILPFLVLLKRCQSDPDQLPPCRLEEEGGCLSPSLSPGMAFFRADAVGPVGVGGDQLKAMHGSLASVLEKSPLHVLIDTATFMGTPVWLTTMLEERNAWTALLAIHMRFENWTEAVRLVETHLRYWRPSSREEQIIVNVPQLIQLQRALGSQEKSEEQNFLVNKLDQTLDILKETLFEISDRMV